MWPVISKIAERSVEAGSEVVAKQGCLESLRLLHDIIGG
jgi:hypothetical protein